MRNDTYPIFTIAKVVEGEKGLGLVGSVSSEYCKNEKWLDDNWLGYLKDDESIFHGRWRSENDQWKFLVDLEDARGMDFNENQNFTVFDGYWGERVELVTNRNIQWQNAFYQEEGNHDHCAICWATLSERENQKHMRGDGEVAVCLSCFESYIKPRSFGFIVCA